ncbi:DUF4278 domain-containing protein [Thermoleptolyngbya sp. M55_K2018_002]|uniref:DUF4278 domain-containing protein n=1 Tax=Thermoleptolyngbya sp. M55_K2018_002 TaxID=2747808 RepID=UPI0019DC854C|nr:DUF4278 domain-containing protein [Thermoleptolyngbya sp. M55_K2018_002]HIK39407.1 DUF4278 domain-containing protein [Thermoleptolyngbya sp. M55_K2018_002]
MNLTYRGTEYIASNQLPTTSQSFNGCYRGAEMTMHSPSKLPTQVFVNLTYRGAQYRAEAKPSFVPENVLAI